MTTDSSRNVKARFSEFVDRVDREHERVVVTRNGRPAAVLISARGGNYRVLSRTDERQRTVTVLRIDHWGDVYRTR